RARAGHAAPAAPSPAAPSDAYGGGPRPPSSERAAAPADAERYQTMFAREPGAVAAPTAGLHFTPALVAALAARGIDICPITLNVGPGTFAPVRTDDLDQHVMHAETYVVP